MQKYLLAIILSLSILDITAQNDTIPLNIKFEYGIHFDPLNGISLNDTGLYAKRAIHKKRTFFSRSPYKFKSIYIPYNELDPNILYRLRILLITHDYFKDVKSFPKDNFDTGTPHIVSIFNNKNEYIKEIIDYRYSGAVEDSLSYDRFLLNELAFLLNDLIPDKYSELKISVGSRPSPVKIKEDNL